MSEREFWAMTYAQLSYLGKRHRQREEREELLTGLLASVTANYSAYAPSDPLCPADFFPGHRQPQFEPETDEDIAMQFSAVLANITVPAPRGQPVVLHFSA